MQNEVVQLPCNRAGLSLVWFSALVTSNRALFPLVSQHGPLIRCSHWAVALGLVLEVWGTDPLGENHANASLW